MTYECDYYVKGSNEKKFFTGDKVRIYKAGAWQFYGTITRVTSRGFYVDTGKRADSYFRPGELTELEEVE